MILSTSIPILTDREQLLISEFVEKEFGIKMPPSKKVLLQGRLAKRLRSCGLVSYSEYFDFITKNPAGAEEFLHFTDLVSTHETFFFREEKHFSYLAQEIIPRLCAQSGKREIRILSAACSSGEECYTLAMAVSEALENAGRSDVQFTIEGFDLSQKMVEMAHTGIYTEDRIQRIPPFLRSKYLMKSKSPHRQVYRFTPEIRSRMTFYTANLLGAIPFQKNSYDVIFCRNLLIYFDKNNQLKAIHHLLRKLDASGYLFLGHSESMNGLRLPIRSVAISVFQKN